MKKLKPKEMVIGHTAAALYMNRSREGVYKLVKANKIHPIEPYVGSVYFSRAELDKFKKEK